MTVTLYKLTTQDDLTRKGYWNETKWGPGVTHSGNGEGDLCGPGYIHAYLSPELAVLLNPIHANIKSPKLWLCSADSIAKNDQNLKVGCVSLTTIRQIPLPVFTNEQKVIFAILCAEAAMKAAGVVIPAWQSWTDDYKSGRDRSGSAAYAAYAAARAARAAAYAAAHAADAAAYAAYAADAAAHAAAHAAARATARATAHAATYAAARAAADAADAAARAADIDLVGLAKAALAYK